MYFFSGAENNTARGGRSLKALYSAYDHRESAALASPPTPLPPAWRLYWHVITPIMLLFAWQVVPWSLPVAPRIDAARYAGSMKSVLFRITTESPETSPLERKRQSVPFLNATAYYSYECYINTATAINDAAGFIQQRYQDTLICTPTDEVSTHAHSSAPPAADPAAYLTCKPWRRADEVGSSACWVAIRDVERELGRPRSVDRYTRSSKYIA